MARIHSPIRLVSIPSAAAYNVNMRLAPRPQPTLPRYAWLTLIGILSLLASGFMPAPVDEYPRREPQPGPIRLRVKPLQQKKITSCGESAITMAYNYLYPETPLQELDVVAFAMQNSYYMDDRPPFTSPQDMLAIARHYSGEVSSGWVATPEEGLNLLLRKLRNGEPVIIDALTWLDDPYSGAHFIVVTGVTFNSSHDGGVIIHYNNPLTARNESARWLGGHGVWNAWQNNGDPDGSGWWMNFHRPQ